FVDKPVYLTACGRERDDGLSRRYVFVELSGQADVIGHCDQEAVRVLHCAQSLALRHEPQQLDIASPVGELSLLRIGNAADEACLDRGTNLVRQAVHGIKIKLRRRSLVGGSYVRDYEFPAAIGPGTKVRKRFRIEPIPDAQKLALR